jgi:iron complex outermembrane receptor protein
MQHPDYIIPSRRLLPRRLAAGLLLTQLALVSFGQTPAADTSADPEKENAEKTVVLEKLTVQAGFAGSLAAAAEKKQEAISITEVISSEDLGKLPDISIADALTRLPGLAAQRTNGRAQQISVRGLNGDFSTATLNGREQVSTNLNRAVEFDQYPADLLDTVTVFKTASASLPSQGIAGTIDMQTVSPLSKTGRQIAVNGYYQWNDLGELTPGVSDSGYRTGLAYIDQFNDGKVGIAIGVSLASTPWAGEQFQAWGYPTEAGGAYVLGGTKSYVRNSILDRNAIMGVLEFRPSDNLHLKFDIYAADFEEKQLLRGMEVPLWWSSAAIQPGYTVSDGLVTNSTFGNVMPVIRNDVFKRTDSPLALGANAVFGEKSAWPVTLDLGYSKIERKDQNLETWSGISFRGVPFTTADTMNVKLIPGEVPVITPTKSYATGSGVLLSDPQGWGPTNIPGGGMHGYLKYFQAKDEMGQFKAFTRHELGKWFKSVELGTSYTDRYKRDGEGPSGFISPANGANTLPLPPTVGTTDMSFLGVGGIYAYDPLAASESGIWTFTPNNDGGIVANRYEIREKVAQFYGMLNIDSKIGSLPVTGNIGLRAIYVDQSSDGYSANGNTLTPVSGGDEYWDYAPNLNLNFKPDEDFVIRFSVAKQLARPRMYDMRASRTWSYNPANAGSTNISQSPWSGNGGNPALRPWESISFDLSLEKYFAQKRGYFAVAGFTKDLQNYIYEQQSVADFTGYPITGPEPVLRQGIVTQPVNGDGGHLNGVEITLSVSSELFSHGNVKGFGLIMSGAYTDSSIKPWGPTNADAPIAGLSDKVANFTAYYERRGFSIRISDRYRSENRQYITTFGVPSPGGDVNPNGGFSVAQPENVIDAQISYAFQGFSLKGLTILAQGYNLNNEPLITYDNNDPRRVINYQTYGASYSVGVSYKF